MLDHAGSYLQDNGKRIREGRDGDREGEMAEMKEFPRMPSLWQ